MAKTADTMASTHKERKPKKVLSHIEIHEAENGGHTIRHHFTHYEHAPEEHVFGKGESMKAHEHIASAMNMPMKDVGAGEDDEETEVESKEAAEA